MATKKRPAGKTGSSTSRSRQQRQGQSSTTTAAPRNDGAELLQASLPGTDTPQPAPEAAEAPAVTPVVAEEAAPEQPKECHISDCPLQYFFGKFLIFFHLM